MVTLALYCDALWLAEISRATLSTNQKKDKNQNRFTQTCARVLLSIVWFSYQISVRITNCSFFPSEYNIEYFKRGKTSEKSINEQLKYFRSWLVRLVSWTNVDSSGRRTPFEKRRLRSCPCRSSICFLLFSLRKTLRDFPNCNALKRVSRLSRLFVRPLYSSAKRTHNYRFVMVVF